MNVLKSGGSGGATGVVKPDGMLKIVEDLASFEAAERVRLELDGMKRQWFDPNPNNFTAAQRAQTTILVSGLTMAHDAFIRAALSAANFKMQVLDCPDNESLRFGKEFGNRGQCNPTYFTVGNLVKYLCHLRDELGMSTPEIIDRYVFLTAGACGPCRFGMYVTEYRKALRDAGFENFRVILVSQSGAVQSASGGGFTVTRRDVLRVFRGIMIGDVLNAMMYRIRPYEIEPGATDRAVEACRDIIAHALERKRSLIRAAWKCRKILAKVRVDRTRVKPRAAVIGEFWAMTTEGDGNYRLQRFLEEEGAEVDIQLVTNWLLFLIWEGVWDTRKRQELRGLDIGKKGLMGVRVRKRLAALWAADKLVRTLFQTYAKAMGLKHKLSNQHEIAEISHRYYDNHVRGGEGHMEVGKLIQNVLHSKVNMTISVKPFGCMPSSGVSDGVQTAITELFPQAIFLPIETSGDGAVNVYSRVQMQLFKAKQAAKKEVETALAQTGLTMEEVKERLARKRRFKSSLFTPRHRAGCCAADMVYEAAPGTARSDKRTG